MDVIEGGEKTSKSQTGEGEALKVLEFPPTPGFGKWSAFFPDEAVSHPAKMNLNLLDYLITHYTKEGDTILDPMSGSGSTGVLSALSGRNAVLIELEEKFCEWIREAVKRVEMQQTLIEKGKIVVIQGDARNIPTLLKEHEKEISAIITSPPYGNRLADGKLDDDDERGRMKYSDVGANDTRNIGFLPLIPQAASIIFSPPYSLGHDSGDNASEEYSWRLEEQRKHTRAYSSGNIARMPLGLGRGEGVDCVLFSPPYASSLTGKRNRSRAIKRAEMIERYAKMRGKKENWHTPGRVRSFETMASGYSDSKENIGNLGYSPDEIIFSPPYYHALHDTTEKRLEWDNSCDKAKADKGVPVGYSEDPANIGNITTFGLDTPISTVLFSPPYEGAPSGGRGMVSRDPKVIEAKEKGETTTTTNSGVPIAYSANEKNSGNLKSSEKEYEEIGKENGEESTDSGEVKTEGRNGGKSKGKNGKKGAKKNGDAENKETYLSAMKKVYAGCYEVLKPQGRMILVVKDFIRNFQIVELHTHTRQLCESCGFIHKETLLFKLPQQSFWRILFKKKYGDKVKDLDKLDYEWILVFEKP